jgi:transposase
MTQKVHSQEKHEAKLIQHLGIVAGICKESRLAELIDERITQPKRNVTVGQATVAMILNALGLSGRALYLTKRFFVNRPVDQLIAPHISPADLHDFSLGTALDEIYDAGITELFSSVAGAILEANGITTRFAHLDSTTFSLHGQYNSEKQPDEIEEGLIHITKGYSKDGAPELNQVVVQMICAHKSSIPIWIEALSGNTSDKKSFSKTVAEFQQQFVPDRMPYMVMDSAFYTKDNLQECEAVRWVTRVPETIKEVITHYQELDRDSMKEIVPGYRYVPVDNEYAEVRQRWLLVYSEQAYQREMRTFEKNLAKLRDRSEKDLKHLRNRPFACEADAQAAATAFASKLRYHRLEWKVASRNRYMSRGRPACDATPDAVEWYVGGSIEDDESKIEAAKRRKGMFVVATNELDPEALTDRQLLEVYKDQGVTVERGFRFLKDPMFYAESLYLKLPKRIMALIMVMTLSLLMYALAERRVRKALDEADEHIWDQKGGS